MCCTMLTLSAAFAGLELNPNQWLPLKMLWATEAMQDWEHRCAQRGHCPPSKNDGDLIKKSPSLPEKRKPGRPRISEKTPKKSPSLPEKRKPGRPMETKEIFKKNPSLREKRKPGRPRKSEETLKKNPSLPEKRKPGRPRKTVEAPKKARNQSQSQKGEKQALKRRQAGS